MRKGELIFVYGTLRPGCHAYDFLEGRTNLIGEARIPGAELYNLGAYPGVKLSEDQDKTVTGNILEITDDHLWERLDAYEGYPRLYDRKIVQTTTGQNCWVYVYNHGDIETRGKLIPSGDWFDVSKKRAA